MISIGLLSEVLNLVEVKGIYDESDYTYDLCDRELNYAERLIVFDTVGYNKYMIINIYELAHKCKEWAKLKYFIDIDSHSGCARWGAEAVSHNGRPSVFYEQVFIGRTETDAIFKACEWIMENTK